MIYFDLLLNLFCLIAMSSYQIFFCLKYYAIIILKYNHRYAIYIYYIRIQIK